MAEFGPSSDPDLDAAVAVRFDQLREMPPPDTWTAVDAARRRRWLLPAVAAAVAVAGIAALALATARGGDESIDDPEPPSTTLPVAVGRYASSTIDPTPVVRTPIDPNPSFLFLPTGGVERVDCGADDQLFVYTAADPPVALGSIGSGVSGSADFVPVGPGGELEVSGCGNAPSSTPSKPSRTARAWSWSRSRPTPSAARCSPGAPPRPA